MPNAHNLTKVITIYCREFLAAAILSVYSYYVITSDCTTSAYYSGIYIDCCNPALAQKRRTNVWKDINLNIHIHIYRNNSSTSYCCTLQSGVRISFFWGHIKRKMTHWSLKMKQRNMKGANQKCTRHLKWRPVTQKKNIKQNCQGPIHTSRASSNAALATVANTRPSYYTTEDGPSHAAVLGCPRQVFFQTWPGYFSAYLAIYFLATDFFYFIILYFPYIFEPPMIHSGNFETSTAPWWNRTSYCGFLCEIR